MAPDCSPPHCCSRSPSGLFFACRFCILKALALALAAPVQGCRSGFILSWKMGLFWPPGGSRRDVCCAHRQADQLQEFPLPAMAPHQDYPLSIPTHTEKMLKQKSFGTSLLHKQHFRVRGCRLGRAVVPPTSLGDSLTTTARVSTHPHPGSPTFAHKEPAGPSKGHPLGHTSLPPDLSHSNTH